MPVTKEENDRRAYSYTGLNFVRWFGAENTLIGYPRFIKQQTFCRRLMIGRSQSSMRPNHLLFLLFGLVQAAVAFAGVAAAAGVAAKY